MTHEKHCPLSLAYDEAGLGADKCQGCKVIRAAVAEEIEKCPNHTRITCDQRELSYLSSELLLAQKELAALRAALAVAEEMAELLLTLSDPEYLPRIRELANGVVTRFHAARKVGK